MINYMVVLLSTPVKVRTFFNRQLYKKQQQQHPERCQHSAVSRPRNLKKNTKIKLTA